MESLRQLLAFPLYATIIWLLWVLGRLLGDSGWLIGCLLMLALVFAIWLARGRSQLGFWSGNLVAVAALAICFAKVIGFSNLQTNADAASQQTKNSAWQEYNPQLIAQARADGQGVFIDYTAAWCITCQVNKQLVLDTKPVLSLFERNQVLMVRADWTQHDPLITESLAQLGRNSVPVYAWYAPGAKQAQLLPQILQSAMIEALFEQRTALHTTKTLTLEN